jgi:uncharacterized membrane protein (DUF106 family)
MGEGIDELKREIDELERKENSSFWSRIKDELREERDKPVRLSPLNIFYIALIIIVVVAFILLFLYIYKNIGLLNSNPCVLCERAGNFCSRVRI